MEVETNTEAIDKLYQHFYLLSDAKDGIAKHSDVYLEIINAAKGQSKEKILASQFIARFFKHFPDQAHLSIEGLLDLCEDEDVLIRKQAIKDLPSLCRENKKYAQKIADILAQLLQAEDTTELAVVHNSLMTILKMDAKSCLSGIFTQILQGEDSVREKCLRFLCAKLRGPNKEYITKDAEELIITEAKKVLQDVTAVEFYLAMEVLGNTRLAKTLSGQQELVDLVAEQAEIGQAFAPGAGEEGEFLDRLISCVRVALPYFSTKIPSTKFLDHVLGEVLPRLDTLIPEGQDNTTELDLFKVTAELSTYTGVLDKISAYLKTIFDLLLKYLPLPPPELDDVAEPKLEFSYVECLMYTFHRLLKQQPEFLSNADILKDFRQRLQYFARGIQGYIKKLREALSDKSKEELKADENKIKVVALRTTNNINTLIKDLFHCPPSTKAVVTLSWKVANSQSQDCGEVSMTAAETISTGTKRHTPITFEGKTTATSVSPPKRARELYQPPGGKYSNTLSAGPRGGGGYRGGRGRFRGRGRGRW